MEKVFSLRHKDNFKLKPTLMQIGLDVYQIEDQLLDIVRMLEGIW